MAKFETVDQYVASFPPPVQEVLGELRQTIRRAIPGSDESIRYNMPCIKLDGTYVVHFAAWKKHIGMYPIPGFDDSFENEIAPYRAAKDTIRLRYRQPIPYDLIGRLVTRIAGSRAE
jgi:uncharacterized protein YdhG (YjbR/CyaY superfamily)